MLLRRGCAWLTLMPLLLSLSAGELSFYRDELPEASEDTALEHRLARYLKAQRLQQRLYRYMPMFLPPAHKEHGGLQDRLLERQNVLEALGDGNTLLENLLKQNQKAMRTAHHHRPDNYYDPLIDQIVDQEPGYYSSSYDNLERIFYPKKERSNVDDERFAKDLAYGNVFDVERAMMEEPMDDPFHADHNHAMGMFVHHEGGKEGTPVVQPAAAAAEEEEATGPEFTFKFDDSNLEEKHPFAVKPNDPRYYSDSPFSSDNFDRQDASRANWEEEKAAHKPQEMLMKHEDDSRIDRKLSKDLSAGFDADSESERFLLERRPLVVPINRELNSDMYFIAIVAGCSAAAMFALVLIILTWCRLQRGAKAAADIEYPAYGVTGPNKDVSPSGDQRLAQSAQMYHFQHQKQQIIAMENRTSATRDPGSLSEAESDEENEEGDYTVYECPGLASTGEMEVKNPMFHDDPTPATPMEQGNNKEEDHI